MTDRLLTAREAATSIAMSWKRLARGIYQDAYSIQAVVNIAAGRKTKRFPHGTSLVEIKRWRNEQKVKLDAIARRRPRRDPRGTLRADVRASAKAHVRRPSDLAPWVALYGAEPRYRLTLEHAKAAVKTWREQGRVVGTTADGEELWRPYAEWSIRHFVNALRQLYHGLDGADAPTPVDGLSLGRPPQTTPVFVTPRTIVDVAANLKRIADTPDPRRKNHRRDWMQTRARHMVLSAHGARPIELARAQPEDVSLTHRLWTIRTAKGGIGRVLRLNTPEMLDAWRAFIAAKAWGDYDRSRHAKRLRRAGWPAGVRPYALRGTWGMEISRRGADLADIQPLMGHADLKTTRAYYVPAEDSRLAQATRATAGRLRWK
jgi:integrase